MKRRRVAFEHQHWPYRRPLAISREIITAQDVVVVTLEEDGVIGCGEACPTARHDEQVGGTLAAINALVPALEDGLDRATLQRVLPACAARNAIDCALWDLEARRSGKRAWQLAGLREPAPVLTSQTIGLDTPQAMADAAAAAWSPLLKLKLGGDGDLERVEAVRAASPSARLIVDANEAWSLQQLRAFPARLAALGVELIEQPLRAGEDALLQTITSPIRLAADESFRDSATVERVRGRYQLANIKLDKTGGLTEALRVREAAIAAGLDIMVGCMGGTSLAMAPALLLAGDAAMVDLDGPQVLARDRDDALRYVEGRIEPGSASLWG